MSFLFVFSYFSDKILSHLTSPVLRAIVPRFVRIKRDESHSFIGRVGQSVLQKVNRMQQMKNTTKRTHKAGCEMQLANMSYYFGPWNTFKPRSWLLVPVPY